MSDSEKWQCEECGQWNSKEINRAKGKPSDRCWNCDAPKWGWD
jgi:hypothetical protein